MKLQELFSATQIQQQVQALGQKISQDFKDQELYVVPILTGSLLFTADLIRQIKGVDVQLHCMAAASYHGGTQSSGNVQITFDLNVDIYDKNILLVEDIVDTGTTLLKLRTMLEARHPRQIKLAALLSKAAQRIHVTPIDYLGFEVENQFVVGYGLDYQGPMRELPYIGVFAP